MRKYTVEGMTCAACVARVERAVLGLEGVTSCSVNLLTNSMTIEGDAAEDLIFSAILKAGYKVKIFEQKDEKAADDESKGMLKRLLSSLVFLLALMYVSMGYTMWGFPMPSFFKENPVAIGFLQFVLSAVILVINKNFFISGFKGIIHRSPNMDTLVSVGSAAAFIYSSWLLFSMTISNNSAHLIHDLYFESAAMILTIVTVGKMLEAYSKGKTTTALKALMNLSAKTAVILKDGKETSIPANQVKRGDIFVLRPGDSVPADGRVIRGESTINESALTGESLPAEKREQDLVSSGTVNLSGYLECEALRVAGDTLLDEIIKTVNDATASKAPIAKIADKVSGVFVPIVSALAVITAFVWLTLGQTAGYSLARAISVLVISCPCALGLATPVAIMVGNGRGSRLGILFKNAESLENAGRVKIVALDKTGTITEGQPSVTDIIPFNIQKEELLRLAASLEHGSEHPLAKAIIKEAKKNNISYPESVGFKALQGNGVQTEINQSRIVGGSFKFLSSCVELDESIEKTVESLSAKGKTPLLFAKDDKFVGIIAVADTVKADAKEAIERLKKMGVSVVMLTGDNEITARYIAEKVGIKKVVAGIYPDKKAEIIKSFKDKGKVAMVGDGINDSPALAVADIGIAIGKGADIAIDSADIVLKRDGLLTLPQAIALSRATLRIIKQNLFWAFVYNVMGIPLAAGAFTSLFGWQLSPMLAATAMSISSVCVVTNAIRLSRVKLFRDRKVKNMKKTIKIEGMMCPHCEKRVKELLEKMPEVLNAEVSHQTGTAVLEMDADISDEIIKAVIEAEGYKVL